MDRLSQILNRLPHFYSRGGKLVELVRSVSDEMTISDVQIDRLSGMVGIDSTVGADLDVRWGRLFNIPRMAGESDDIYRNRMRTSITNLAGGTADSIKYAIAVVLGINNDQAMMDDRIKVYDAWLYTGSEPSITKQNGYVVCTVNLNGSEFSYVDAIQDVIQAAVDVTKASGVEVQLLLSGYRITTYTELNSMKYSDLEVFHYDQIGA